MKIILLLVAAAGIAGCGLDVASSAATAGSIKKRELEQAQKTMHNAQQKLDATMQQVQAREREGATQE
jgi:NifU-like protein involved in Fe-S cluster formation